MSTSIPRITTFSEIPELIIVDSWYGCLELDFTKQPSEIIVDSTCGAAVLRGAHIYAPGVLGMPRGSFFVNQYSVMY